MGNTRNFHERITNSGTIACKQLKALYSIDKMARIYPKLEIYSFRTRDEIDCY